MSEPARDWDEEPLLLEALEADQLVESKRPYGRRRLRRGARVLMWALRIYLGLALLVVVDRIVQVAQSR
jgi:hypothetical protein